MEKNDRKDRIVTSINMDRDIYQNMKGSPFFGSMSDAVNYTCRQAQFLVEENQRLKDENAIMENSIKKLQEELRQK